VSSPHAIWNAEESRLFVYYHGDNKVTRYATTKDGIRFEYGGEAVRTDMFDNITEASYARVFRQRIPSKNNKYILMFMGNHEGTRNIYLAWSADGRKWDAQREPLITPPAEMGVTQICAPWLFNWNGRNYIIYHGDKTEKVLTDLYASEIDPGFKKPRFAGLFYDRHNVSADNERSSDPCIVSDGKKIYLFMSTGTRLHQNLSLAIASESKLR
jgi:hypothetical protein